jgi:chemotaxis signal transduction protein
MDFVKVRIDDQVFVVRAADVLEIIPTPKLTKLPHQSPDVLGVFHHRGSHVVVHGTEKSLSTAAVEPQFIVVTSSKAGFGVTHIDGIIHEEEPDIQPPQRYSDVLRGILATGDEHLMLIIPEQLTRQDNLNG